MESVGSTGSAIDATAQCGVDPSSAAPAALTPAAASSPGASRSPGAPGSPVAPGSPGAAGSAASVPGGAGPDLLAVLEGCADPTVHRHVERLPPRPGRPAPWPSWAAPELVRALETQGVARPWVHQTAAAELAHAGHDVVLCTGTASGKSLGYQIPLLTALLDDPRATAIYLAPTKALGADQLASIEALDLRGVRSALFDGDTPLEERDWVRAHASLVLTNPDMLHRGVLGAHTRWRRLLRRLRYVIVDECHAYRGVFGSHVALVLRRLRRLAELYGAKPVFVLASATAADPAASAGRLIGRAVQPVVDDGAPRGAADFVLWEPGVLPHASGLAAAPLRRSAPAEAARMMADLVGAGARTLTFVRSRHGAEQTALSARRRLAETSADTSGTAPALADRVAAYRGGYLPEDRRALERALGTGELLGVASTNALELGIDIAGLDATVLAGYPGTLASLWQQAGRAGRRADPERRALMVFVARDDPLDSYLVHHPELVFGRAVEPAITDPTNPYILGPHLTCAAAERHLTLEDLELFGGAIAVRPVLDDLVARGVLRRRPKGWFLAEPGHPADAVDLRGSGAGQVAIVEAASGRLLGTVDAARAPAAVHEGAVHLHRGESYVVLDLDLDEGVAYVEADRPEWTTVARSHSTVSMTGQHHARTLDRGVRAGVGPVCVTQQVVGYLRRLPGGELLDLIPLDMPVQTLPTRAAWYTVPSDVLLGAGLTEARIPGALHAAEHAAIGLLPLFAGCDRWDIGGLSTAVHPDTGEPTVLVYDGYPGGAGFADRGAAILVEWLTAVREAVGACGCAAGCPSCVQSPKCGNGNSPLDKAGALVVLDLVVTAAGRGSGQPPLHPQR